MKRNPKDIFFVGTQFILFVAYLFQISKIDFAFPDWLKFVGLFISVVGIIISLAALLTLNKNLSPFPTPKQGAELIQSGIYKYIRHPIYSGILFFTLGFSIYSENTLRLLIFFTLLILFSFKAAYEEKLLLDKFPNYADYKKTTGMFLPGIKQFSQR
jgi:protein-S-isoprenylcysteine O-methyltransferase Ste14